MKSKTLRQLMLYNYRYIFAYAIIALFLAYFLFWQLGSIGPGLSQVETATAATHTNALETLKSPTFPLFAKLQIVSLKLFGASDYSIRIPSIVIAIATILLLYPILKKWFGKPTALLSIALVASADWFLFVARHATGAIEFSFWFTVALFAIMKILEKNQKWGFILAAALSALLFVPFGPYLVAALVASIITSRVMRVRLLEINWKIKTCMMVVLLVSLGLLGFTVINDTSIAKQLLGVTDSLPSPSQYLKSLITNGSSVFALVPYTNPVNGPQGVFFVRFFELIFILFGIFMFWKTRVNRLNILVISSAVVLFLVGGLSDSSIANSLLLVPFIIFITAGMRYFIHRWQKTFPKNPYARTIAFIPVVILLFLTAVLHHQSYFVLWPHQQSTADAFSYDLKLVQNELDRTDSPRKCLVVTSDADLQLLLTESKFSCQTTIQSNLTPVTKGVKQIIAPDIYSATKPQADTNVRFVTSPRSSSALNWVVRTASE